MKLSIILIWCTFTYPLFIYLFILFSYFLYKSLLLFQFLLLLLHVLF